MTRSPEELESVISALGPDVNPYWRPHDMNGDGISETLCNIFLHRVTMMLGAPVPYVLANLQAAWLGSDVGRAAGWRPVKDATAAAMFAANGLPVVPSWVNPSGVHGHVALCVPPRGREGVWIAQAGKTAFARGTLAQGFGEFPVRFYVHD